MNNRFSGKSPKTLKIQQNIFNLYYDKTDKFYFLFSNRMSRKDPEGFGNKGRELYKITKDKLIYILLIFFILIFGSYLVLSSLEIKRSQFTPNPIKIGGLYIKLNCQSINTEFITEDSKIMCYLSVISDDINYDYVYVFIQAVNIENTSERTWSCHANLLEITNKTYSNSTLCSNPYFDDIFMPEVPGTFKFKIAKLDAKLSLDHAERGIEYSGTPEEYYKRDLVVIPTNEAFSMKITYLSLLVAIFASFLGTCGLILEIRRFLKGDQSQIFKLF